MDRGHGRIDVRTIKTLPPTERILARWPDVKQVFLVERYSYGTDGELLGAVAVLGITSLPAGQALLTCSLTCAATGPSRCTIMSVMSCWGGRQPHPQRVRAMAAVRNAVAGILHLHQVPNIAAQLRANHRDPYQPLFIRYLASLDGLADGITEQHAAELCWALTDGHLYRLLVAQRGWSTTDFSRWLSDSLAAALLPP